jgi:hypothetical protein
MATEKSILIEPPGVFGGSDDQPVWVICGWLLLRGTNLLVIRPGAPTQQLDASFQVEAGKITAINLTPRQRPPRTRGSRGERQPAAIRWEGVARLSRKR